MDGYVDILMAVYNGERFLNEQIASIVKQSHRNIHLTIRDDASTDNTLKIIQEARQQHPDLISCIQSKQNQGLLQNFSQLMEHSQGPYVMLCDQDDVWHEDKVHLTLSKMREAERNYGKNVPLLIHTDLKVVDQSLKSIHPSFWSYCQLNPAKGLTLNRLLAQNTITGCTLMANRALIKLALPIPKECIMHDWWFGLVAAAFGKVAIVPEATMLYRQHGGNDTGAKKYGLLSYVKRFYTSSTRQKMEQNYRQRYIQASVFLDRYNSLLKPEQKKLFEIFLQTEKASTPKKAFWIHRYNLRKQGLLRQLHDILS